MGGSRDAIPLRLGPDDLILIVEDDPAQRRTLEQALGRHGVACQAFDSGEEALAECNLDRVVAAVLDVQLPGMDGIELGRRLKERDRGGVFLPVVLVGGLAASEDRVRAFQVGCDDFLAKPIHHFELAVRLASLLARRAQHVELLAANESLRRGLEKKRELAALVVHDLRNPLAAIHGNVQLLREDVDPENEAWNSCLSDIEELSLKALSLVAGLLDVEELEEGLLLAERTVVDVESFARAFPPTYRVAVAARQLELVVEVESGICAELDEALIGRVVENLLDNAVRYAPRRGRVELRACSDGRDLVIEVGNSGPPIPELEHERIFGRYYRLEARRAGARANRGLGLYFCKLAVEAHGGTITVASRDGLPACFVLRLPGAISAGRPESR